AVGSGQMWGKGIGKGTQTHLRFLPEFHTDFIFALIAEEMGFVGAVLVICLFALFMLRGVALARDCPDLAGSLLAVGCVTIIGFHVFVNIAITLHLLPITGLPLPFLSYGGSFCVTTMMCVGTLLSVHVRKGFFD
ncbi:MAG TPA: FtsW/RodA/SpoVE family cell cycle protein, partial [Candidatus Hydrogenedentes bacterium]|nr:FtsW/RodA/SpoVE family cell cycle protein [Candidatus Hydrogenedentota bacterium]